MAAELTEGHYIRSTNQWSDPATQCWLYGGDVAEEADAVLKAKFGKESSGGQEQTVSGIQAMIGAGLLVSPPSDV
jgi:salicylate hydroxylase